jgi:6-pyruvoyl-tetrahydropterin synthase
MKRSWPKVTGSIRFEFWAKHAMPRIGKGCEASHLHHYAVWFGWTHEIQPTSGFTHEYLKQRGAFESLIGKLREQYLNDVLPMQPSAEALALWLLANTDPAYCDHVIVETYDNYRVRVDRALQRSEWMEFLAGRGSDPYSSPGFTLK